MTADRATRERLPADLAVGELEVKVGEDDDAQIVHIAGAVRSEVAVIRDGAVHSWHCFDVTDDSAPLSRDARELSLSLQRRAGSPHDLAIDIVQDAHGPLPSAGAIVLHDTQSVDVAAQVQTSISHTWRFGEPVRSLPASELSAELIEACRRAGLIDGRFPAPVAVGRAERGPRPEAPSPTCPAVVDLHLHRRVRWVDADGVHGRDDNEHRCQPWGESVAASTAGDAWNPPLDAVCAARLDDIEASVHSAGPLVVALIRTDDIDRWLLLSGSVLAHQQLHLGIRTFGGRRAVADCADAVDPRTLVAPMVRGGTMTDRRFVPMPVALRSGRRNPSAMKIAWSVFGTGWVAPTVEPPEPAVQMSLQPLIDRAVAGARLPSWTADLQLKITETWTSAHGAPVVIAYSISGADPAGQVACAATGQAFGEVWIDRENHVVGRFDRCAYCAAVTCVRCTTPTTPCNLCGVPVCTRCQPRPGLCTACNGLTRAGKKDARAAGLGVGLLAKVLVGQDHVHQVWAIHAKGAWQVHGSSGVRTIDNPQHRDLLENAVRR